jgi:hypothetical protein
MRVRGCTCTVTIYTFRSNGDRDEAFARINQVDGTSDRDGDDPSSSAEDSWRSSPASPTSTPGRSSTDEIRPRSHRRFTGSCRSSGREADLADCDADGLRIPVIADRATVSSKTSTGMFRIVQDDRGRGGSAGPQCASDDCVGNPIQYPEGVALDGSRRDAAWADSHDGWLELERFSSVVPLSVVARRR